MGVLIVLFTMIITILTVGVMVGVIPYIVRRNLHFGVTLPDAANELELTKKWKKQFLTFSLLMATLGALSIIAGLFFNLDEEGTMQYMAISGTVALAVMGIVQLVMYLRFHDQAKKLKQEQFSSREDKHDARIMVSMDFHRQKTTISNWWMIIIGSVIIMATATFPFMMYDQIPDLVPVSWNLDTVAFREKSPGMFMFVPALQLSMLAIFLFANYSFRKMKQVIRPEDAERSMMQNIRFRQAMSKFLMIIGILTLLLVGSIQVMMVLNVQDGSQIGIFGVGIALVALAGTLYLMWKYGQGGERYKSKGSSEMLDSPYHMVDDDEGWILGIIYYNPKDPALFVETRFGMGNTINMARPAAWWMILGIVMFIVMTLVISFRMVD